MDEDRELKRTLIYWKKQGFKKVFIMGNENEISHGNQNSKKLKRIARRVEKMTKI